MVGIKPMFMRNGLCHLLVFVPVLPHVFPILWPRGTEDEKPFSLGHDVGRDGFRTLCRSPYTDTSRTSSGIQSIKLHRSGATFWHDSEDFVNIDRNILTSPNQTQNGAIVPVHRRAKSEPDIFAAQKPPNDRGTFRPSVRDRL